MKGNYKMAEHSLKEGLKKLKQASQDKTLGYLFLLKRLGYVCLLSQKYTESEKYFKVVINMMPSVSKNPSSIFSTHKPLLLYY